MPRSRRNQNKSNKNKNNKILKRMKELSNYYRRKLFRGGALDEAQVARMAELDAKKVSGLSAEEQTEYDSLIMMRDQPIPQTQAPVEVAAPQAPVEIASPQPQVAVPQSDVQDEGILGQVEDAFGSAVESVKSAVGLNEEKVGGKRRSNKRRNNKKQRKSQRKRR
jgi:hypothetical protein